MESGNEFPWEALKAGCLRLVCNQVCASSESGFTNPFGKREEMIEFLRDVNARGLDSALKAIGKSKQTQEVPNEATSGVKRKSIDEDVDDQLEDADADGAGDAAEAPTTPNAHQAYNTRFKGVKRVKMGREMPEGFPYTPHRRGRAPRKSAPALLASASRTTTDESAGSGKVETLKRKRGRPRKNPSPGRPPTSSIKQVFDGVVVVKRANPSKRVPLDDHAASHLDPDADAEGDVDGEVEETVEPQPAELNGLSGAAVHYDSNQGASSDPVADAKGDVDEIVGPQPTELNGLNVMAVEYNYQGESSVL